MTTATPVHYGQPLSEREIEIVAAIADGLRTADTGRLLGITAPTVKSHLQRIGIKLGTGDRAGIVAAAIRAGWLPIGGVGRVRVPVVCACARCRRELVAGEGMAHRIASSVVGVRRRYGRAA